MRIIKEKKSVDLRAPFCLFMRTLPIDFSLLWRKQNNIKSKKTAKLKLKRTLIAAVRDHYLTWAIFPDPLGSRYWLPLSTFFRCRLFHLYLHPAFTALAPLFLRQTLRSAKYKLISSKISKILKIWLCLLAPWIAKPNRGRWVPAIFVADFNAAMIRR
jgi:hypothetical protein